MHRKIANLTESSNAPRVGAPPAQPFTLRLPAEKSTLYRRRIEAQLRQQQGLVQAIGAQQGDGIAPRNRGMDPHLRSPSPLSNQVPDFILDK